MMRFDGKLAVVTGAASGIGAGVAAALVREGADVVAVDLNPIDAASMQSVLADVTDEPAIAELARLVARRGDVSLLFNVAGTISTTTAPDTDLEVWERVMAVNARGPFLMCKHLIPAMAAGGGGSIVNVASVSGLVGLPRRAAYCASKGAVVALTRALAIDHTTDGIRVNCLCPGAVETPLVHRLAAQTENPIESRLARQIIDGPAASADEIAAAALYLASDDARFVTGSILTIDGGLTAGPTL